MDAPVDLRIASKRNTRGETDRSIHLPTMSTTQNEPLDLRVSRKRSHENANKAPAGADTVS